MPIFDSQYPVNSNPAGEDKILTTDTSDASAVKSVTLTKVQEWLGSISKWVTSGMIADGAVTNEKLAIIPPTLQEIKKFTSNGTYLRPAEMSDDGYVIVRVQAGGGGGGGVVGGTSGQSTLGGGGGAGGYSEKMIKATDLNPTETVTVGSGGSGGAAGDNNGGSGSTSSFGSHASANGGSGGSSGSSSGGGAVTAGQTGGGSASGGDVNIRGGSSGIRFRITGTSNFSGHGGYSQLGVGGNSITGTDNGQDGTGYGSGGSGGASANSGGQRAGGNGTAGIVMVYEFY